MKRLYWLLYLKTYKKVYTMNLCLKENHYKIKKKKIKPK